MCIVVSLHSRHSCLSLFYYPSDNILYTAWAVAAISELFAYIPLFGYATYVRIANLRSDTGFYLWIFHSMCVQMHGLSEPSRADCTTAIRAASYFPFTILNNIWLLAYFKPLKSYNAWAVAAIAEPSRPVRTPATSGGSKGGFSKGGFSNRQPVHFPCAIAKP